jgi:hypothetical protein
MENRQFRQSAQISALNLGFANQFRHAQTLETRIFQIPLFSGQKVVTTYIRTAKELLVRLCPII